ncbi:5'-nucleotidase domain-containing [Anaeramoeba flamelloides]|uniref:5'-nucleotidase domain-containing n=1 Tax=Anaeramoeba flamelloides TaxID=1746091 RepID=A0ABQ8Y6X9_9EUKA|nr:5'-nucleotidase domain-containing [Anaeramoeba flamelloides]
MQAFPTSKKAFYEKLRRSKYVGFDMDHTIVKYKHYNLSVMIFDCLKKLMVKEKIYPKKILQQPFVPECCVKGCILDIKNGNLVKIDQQKRVTRALHGDKILDKKTIKEIYGEDRKLTKFTGLRKGGYWSVPTYFDLAEGILFNRITAMNDRGEFGTKRDGNSIFKTVFGSGSKLFRDYNFGEFYQRFPRNIPKYVNDNSFSTLNILKTLKKMGKKTFLLTNSNPDYGTVLLNNLFRNEWKSYFDIILYSSKKPTFFDPDNNNPFIDAKTKKRTKLQFKGVYQNGNITELMNFFRIENGEEIVYFGDHPITDLREAKINCNWTTLAIVEELNYCTNEGHDEYINSRNSRNLLWGNYLQCGNNFSYWGDVFMKYTDHQVSDLGSFWEKWKGDWMLKNN